MQLDIKKFRSRKSEKEEVKLLCTGNKITNLENTVPFIHSMVPYILTFSLFLKYAKCMWLLHVFLLRPGRLFHLISSELTLWFHSSSVLPEPLLCSVPLLCFICLHGISASWHNVYLLMDLFSFSVECKLL